MANPPEMQLHLKCFNCLLESDFELRDITVSTSVAPCEIHGFHAYVEVLVICPHCDKDNIHISTDAPEEE